MFIYSSLALNLCVLGSLHRPLIATKDNQETEALDKTGKSEQCPYHRNNQLDSVTAKSDVTVADGLKADGNKLYKPPERDQPYENNKNINDAIANDIGHSICDKTGDKDETINVCENWSDDIEDAKLTVLKNPKEDIDKFRKHTSVIIVNETAAKENEPMLQRLPNGSAEHSKDHADGTFHPVPHTPEFKRTKYLNHAHNLSQLDDSGSQGSLPNIHKRKLSDTLMSKQNRSLSSLPTLKKSHLMDSQNMLGSNASFEILFERQQCLLTDNECYIHKHDKMQSNNMFVTIIRNAFPKELVTNTNFIILMVATFFFGIAAYIPVALLPDYCLYVGCRIENTGWLISVFGVTGKLYNVLTILITSMTIATGHTEI